MHLLPALSLALFTAVAPPDSTELRGEVLMKALQTGGYTILLRHARTDWSYKEEIGTIPAERGKQRNLSADGVRDAALMGAVLRKYRIPIGEIVASPMFRARETAEYAAGTPSVSMALRVFPSTDEQGALVAAAPKAGTNRLLVTHHFVIEKHVPGIRPGDVGESEAAVVRPTGDGHVALVGRITLADWERLAGVPPTPATVTPPTSPATTSAPPASAAIPDTPAGALARRYLDAFNSGDTTRMRAFIESTLIPNPERPTEQRLQTFVKTFDDFGPMAVVGVRASSADEITLDVRARTRDLVLTVKRSADHAERAASITLGTTQGVHP
jgi:phosphohistidine phosphatase SixA